LWGVFCHSCLFFSSIPIVLITLNILIIPSASEPLRSLNAKVILSCDNSHI
jgi:hypothetical protein